MATVLAIEITPSTPTQWSAHYYPTVETPAGRRVEITTPLHRQSLATAQCLEGPTRCLEVTTDDPGVKTVDKKWVKGYFKQDKDYGHDHDKDKGHDKDSKS